MRIAMSVLAVLALIGGLIQVPGVDHVLENFLAGTFEESALFHITVPTADAWLGLLVGGIISIVGDRPRLLVLRRPSRRHRPPRRAHARRALLPRCTSGTSTSSSTCSSTGR